MTMWLATSSIFSKTRIVASFISLITARKFLTKEIIMVTVA